MNKPILLVLPENNTSLRSSLMRVLDAPELRERATVIIPELFVAGPPVGMSREATAYRMEKKAETAKVADLYLYDIIGDSWDGTTAKQFSMDLKALGELDTLNIYINSPGGSVFDGVAIYNILIRHKAQKIVNIDGVAASIASIIAMAGDKIQIAKNGLMMVHNPWAYAMGNAADFRAAADKLDIIRATLLETYCDRTNCDMKKMSDWMDAETWFNADEAVAAGLCDCVAENDVEIAALVKHDYARFKNAPKALTDKSVGAPANTSQINIKRHPALVTVEARLTKYRART